jgi:translocator protein
MKNKNIHWPKLIISLAIPQAAGALGSLATIPNIDTWYEHLTKPSFNPPNWIFGPVWTILFLLMGIALYLVWREGISKERVKFAMTLFGAQLAFNIIWSYLFFGLNNPGYAFAEIIALWIAIAATIAAFWQVKKSAAYLMLPYLAWVSFAAILNYAIWLLN